MRCPADHEGDPCIRQAGSANHELLRTNTKLAMPLLIHVTAKGTRWTMNGVLHHRDPEHRPWEQAQE